MSAEAVAQVAKYLCEAGAKEVSFEFQMYHNFAFTFSNARCRLTLVVEADRVKGVRVKRRHTLISLIKQFDRCVYVECDGIVLNGGDAQRVWDVVRSYLSS